MTDRSNEPRVDRLSALLRANAPDRFEPGFSQRVLTRLHADDQSLAAALQRQFVRVVPLAAAAALLLASLNWWNTRAAHTSVIDAALNLPQVSLATAYDTTTLYGGTGAATEMP